MFIVHMSDISTHNYVCRNGTYMRTNIKIYKKILNTKRDLEDQIDMLPKEGAERLPVTPYS